MRLAVYILELNPLNISRHRRLSGVRCEQWPVRLVIQGLSDIWTTVLAFHHCRRQRKINGADDISVLIFVESHTEIEKPPPLHNTRCTYHHPGVIKVCIEKNESIFSFSWTIWVLKRCSWKKNYVQLRFNCNIYHIYVLIQTIFLQIETIIEKRKKNHICQNIIRRVIRQLILTFAFISFDFLQKDWIKTVYSCTIWNFITSNHRFKIDQNKSIRTLYPETETSNVLLWKYCDEMWNVNF